MLITFLSNNLFPGPSWKIYVNMWLTHHCKFCTIDCKYRLLQAGILVVREHSWQTGAIIRTTGSLECGIIFFPKLIARRAESSGDVVDWFYSFVCDIKSANVIIIYIFRFGTPSHT